jgi:hypothetical protein
MPHDLRVNGVQHAAAEGKIVDGIQKVGLPHPVMTYKTVHLRRKLQGGLCYVLIIQDG